MKQGLPWSIKGIDPGARDVAKSAAKRDGITLGAWMTKMIFEVGPEGGRDRTITADAGATASAATADPNQVDMNTLIRVVGILIQKVEQAESADSDRTEELAALIKNLSGEIDGSRTPASPSPETSPQLSSLVPEAVEALEAGPEPIEAEAVADEPDRSKADGMPATSDEIPAITDDEAEPVLSLGHAEEVAASAFEASTAAAPGTDGQTSSKGRNGSALGSGRANRLSLLISIGGLAIAGFAIPVFFPDITASFLAFLTGLF